MSEILSRPWCVLAGDEEADRMLAPVVRAMQAEAAARGVVLPALEGVGGPALHAAGVTLGMTLSELHRPSPLPAMFRTGARVKEAAAGLRAMRPGLVIAAGWPEFTMGVIESIEAMRLPVVVLGGPTAWVWRANRGERLAQLVRRVLLFLPFEEAYFRAHGAPCAFIGHPVTESRAGKGDPAPFRAAHGLAEDAPLILVHAGGSAEDAPRFLPAFEGAVQALGREVAGLRAVLAGTSATAPALRKAAPRFPGAILLPADVPGALFDAAPACRLALAAADHHSVTLAACGLPMVLGHRISPVAAMFARRMMALPHVSLINLLADGLAAPEFIQDGCTAERIGKALSLLWHDEAARAAQLARTATAIASLAPPAGVRFSALAAAHLLDIAQGLPPQSAADEEEGDQP